LLLPRELSAIASRRSANPQHTAPMITPIPSLRTSPAGRRSRPGRPLAVVFLAIFSYAAIARAQTAPASPSAPAPAPAASTVTTANTSALPPPPEEPPAIQLETPAANTTAAPVNRSFPLTPTQGHLFGNWLGALPYLQNLGVTPSLTFVSDMAGNPVGGIRHGFTSANNLGLSLLFDAQKIAHIQGGSFLVQVSERFGPSLTKQDIGNVFNVQQVWGGQTIRVVDVAYQQKLLDNTLQFRVGRIAAGDDFLVSHYDYLFMQNGFDGNPVGIFFNAPGMTAYPNAAWGALVKYKPTKRTYVMAGVYNGDPSIRANDHHGMDLSMHGPVYAMAEAGYQLNGQPGDTGLFGNYKAGFWYDNTLYPNYTTQTPGLITQTTRGNYGLYGLFDQMLFRFDKADRDRGFGIFGSALISPDRSTSQMPYFFTAGVAALGLFPNRPQDTTGFGVLYGSFSTDLQAAQQRAGVAQQTSETALELTHRLIFLDGALFVQPDIQYIIRPGGTGLIANALVLGAQVGVNF
jgi:porin